MPPTSLRCVPPNDTHSDHALLLGFGRGDPEASRVFVERYQRRVYGLARSVLGDSTQAEDIAQEALIRAWRNAGSFEAGRGSVSSWLLTITRNLAIDALRKKKAVPADPTAALFLDLPEHRAEPSDAATVFDETGRVRDALRLLPDDQRRALLLAAFYGLSAREISEAESIPLGTAKSRIRSSLRKVRSLLGADENVDEDADESEVAHELIRSLSSLVDHPTTT